MRYTAVVTYAFSPAWLKKSWEERGEFERTHVRPIFARYADRVQARFFDAEAFSTTHTDFMILETDDLAQYYFLMEALRESRLFKDGLVEFKDIRLGVEDGFREYERTELHADRQGVAA